MPRTRQGSEPEQPSRSKSTTGDKKRSRRSKSSNAGDHQHSRERQRNHSFSDMSDLKKSRPQIIPALRVKTQFDSIKQKGLKRNDIRHKRVEISFLEVREYPVVLGDNPACAEGPSLSIDWAHDPQTVFILDVATFEKMRGRRRNSIELLISKYSREKKLLRVGVTKKDMAQAIRESRRIKHSRMVSSQQQGMDNMHESMEKVTSGIKSMFAWKKSSYESMLQKSVENPASFTQSAVSTF